MKGLLTFIKIETLLWFRKKDILFWAIGWPILWFGLMLMIFRAMPGKSLTETVSFYYPSGIALILISTAFVTLANRIVFAKQQKLLLRFRIVPFSVFQYFAGQLASSLVFTTISILSFSVLVTFFQFEWPVLWKMTGIMLLGYFALSGIALMLASFCKTISSIGTLSMVLMTVMMFVSSIFFDLSAAPNAIQWIANTLPGSPFCNGMRALITENQILWRELGILMGWGIITWSIALVTFKFE